MWLDELRKRLDAIDISKVNDNRIDIEVEDKVVGIASLTARRLHVVLGETLDEATDVANEHVKLHYLAEGINPTCNAECDILVRRAALLRHEYEAIAAMFWLQIIEDIPDITVAVSDETLLGIVNGWRIIVRDIPIRRGPYKDAMEFVQKLGVGVMVFGRPRF